jgi:hypothetical protein
LEYAIKGEAGADLKYVEHSGAAIGAGRDSLKDLEKKWSPTVLVCWKTAALPRLEPDGLCGLGKRTTGIAMLALNIASALEKALADGLFQQNIRAGFSGSHRH